MFSKLPQIRKGVLSIRAFTSNKKSDEELRQNIIRSNARQYDLRQKNIARLLAEEAEESSLSNSEGEGEDIISSTKHLHRVGKPMDYLSDNNPESMDVVPGQYLGEDYTHFNKNPLYDSQYAVAAGGDEDDWEDNFVKNFKMNDYRAWKKNLTKEKVETLQTLLAYEQKQRFAKDLLDKMPADKKNYLHVKLKKNPGHYSQTLLKEMTGEQFNQDKWMQKMYDKEADFGHDEQIDNRVVDSISAPASKAIYKTKYKPANKVDGLLYQRERHIMTYTEYQLWREHLEQESIERKVQNLPTYYTTQYEYEVENGPDFEFPQEESKQIDSDTDGEGSDFEDEDDNDDDDDDDVEEVAEVRADPEDLQSLSGSDIEIDSGASETEDEEQMKTITFEHPDGHVYQRQELSEDEYEVQQQEYDYNLHGMANQDFQDFQSYDGHDLAKFDREEIRQLQDSIGPDAAWKEFDMPSLDLKRDIVFEEGRVLRNSVTFDDQRGEDVGIRTQVSMFDKRKQDKFYAMVDMVPPDPDLAVTNEYKELIEEEFGEYQEQEQEFLQNRSDVAFTFVKSRHLYNEIMKMRSELVRQTREKLNAQFEYQPHPQPLHDILGLEQKKIKRNSQKSKKRQIQKLNKLMQKHKFNPQSKQVSDYERELLFLTKKANLSPSQDILRQFDFVLDCLKKQNIKHSPTLKSRIFEYAVLSQQPQLANSILKNSAEESLSETPIAPEYLQKYFDYCLRKDNFDGVAFLTNYCQKHHVDISDYNISGFHNAVQYYLNVDPNISKVMVFTKFYCHFYDSRQQKILKTSQDLDVKDQQLAAKAIFGKHHGLVDMTNLFEYLVNYIGTEQIVDPLTKQDALWSIVDMFTKDPQFYQVSQHAKNDHLSPQAIAKFLGSQFDRPQSLEQVFKVNRRLSETPQKQQFTDQLLIELKDYQSKNNGQLPKSFTQKSLKQIYTKLRSLKRLTKQDEVLLYILKSAGLNNEVIDYCSKQCTSQIKKYYLAEALLQMDKSKSGSYLEALKQANVVKEGQQTACEVTQGTKAVILDKGVKAGLDYFEKEYASLQKQNHARENMLVSMYDSVFDSDRKKTSLKSFKKTFMRSSLVASKVASESYAVHQMTQVIQGKDYDQIEQLFSYYTLLNEKKGLSKLGKRANDDQYYSKRMTEVTERLQVLEHDMSRDDMAAIKNIAEAMDGKQIQVLNKQTQKTVDHYLQMFKDMTLENVEEIRERHTKLEKEIFVPEGIPQNVDSIPDIAPEDWAGQLSDSSEEEFYDNEVAPTRFDQYGEVTYDLKHKKEVDQVFQDFKYIFAKTVQDIAESSVSAMGRPDEDEIIRIQESKQLKHWNKLRQDDMKNQSVRDFDQAEENEIDLKEDEIREEWLEDPLSAENTTLHDPEFLVGETFNNTMAEMKEHLLAALKERKKEILPVAVDIFNKIQGKEFKVEKIDDFDIFHEDYEVKDIDQNLKKISKLIDDKRSPILSSLLQTEHYVNQAPRDQEDDDYRKYDKDSDYSNPLDMDQLARDSENMQDLAANVHGIQSTLKQIRKKLNQEILNFHVDKETPAAQFEREQRSFIQDLYKNWQENQSADDQLSRDDKIKFMKNALAVQLGEQFTTSEFPAFYALDLISFGIQRKQPAAVRLGEKLLAQQGGRMPKTMATEVRNFLLDNKNQKQYKKGMSATSAHSVSSLYHMQHEDDTEKPIFCMDDPYWQDFMAKNSRREDQWRTPSIYAWNHRPYGVIGEVVDTSRLQSMYDKFYSVNK